MQIYIVRKSQNGATVKEIPLVIPLIFVASTALSWVLTQVLGGTYPRALTTLRQLAMENPLLIDRCGTNVLVRKRRKNPAFVTETHTRPGPTVELTIYEAMASTRNLLLTNINLIVRLIIIQIASTLVGEA